MKDKVFIGWSGSNEVATKVKAILENEYNYICFIGGNADNNSKFASIGDTVIQQIKTCNQAIIVFQNREDGSVSNNLFFELGYVFSSYGAKKVHCVRKATEQVVLPSDFDNSFVEPINCSSVDDFAKGIIEYFISRQKMSVDQNKMHLINNRYQIHNIIQLHYSEYGSKCSDYELAQYIIFYMQAAHMFGDSKKVESELKEFKRMHHHEFSSELALAVNLSLSFFAMCDNIKTTSDSGKTYITGETFGRFRDDYEDYFDCVEDDDSGTFDEWAKVFLSEHLTYAYMLFAENDDHSPEMKKSLYTKCIREVDKAMNYIEVLENSTPCKENNDSIGLVSLIKSYLYRNMFVCMQYLGDSQSLKWLEMARKERKALKRNFDNGIIDSKLYANFKMEYYLILSECLLYAEELGIDEYDKQIYLEEISSYLQSETEEDGSSVYVDRIEFYFRRLKDPEESKSAE